MNKLKKFVKNKIEKFKDFKDDIKNTADEFIKEKKGSMEALSGVAKGFAVFAMIMGLTAVILYKFRDAAVKIGGNETETMFDALLGDFNDFVFWGGVVILVIIGSLVMAYMNRMNG